ncbi:MAG: hypothetical protein AAGL24_16080 [Pseudomonadota bacterium]
MRKLIVGLVASVGIAFAAGQAQAATFGFTGTNELPTGSLSFTIDGITVDVTAGTFPGIGPGPNPSNINFATRLVDQDPDGLGADGILDGDQVDGALGNDVLVFTFSREVFFDEITFGNVDGNDDFAFGSVTGNSFLRFVNFQDVVNPTQVASFTTPDQRRGTSFGIGAIGAADNFTIASISVTAVPLPPALLLLGSALVGLGFMSRRRRQAAA